MPTTYVLIDLENVQPASLAPMKGGPYQVRVFVGSQQAKGRVPFEYVLAAQQLAAQLEFVLIEGSGRNALDFHLACYLGQYIAADHKAAFRVIAKDTGYDVLIQHLTQQGIDCLRHPSLEEMLQGIPATPARTRDEQVTLVQQKLERMKATKPKSLKTLRTTIAKIPHADLTDADVEAVVAGLERQGYLTVTGSKVEYARDDEAATTS